MMGPLSPGSAFGVYRVERLLGRGGMSTVYLAHHEGLKRRVALKVLSPELAEDERFRERFARESELAASLEDANALPIYEAGEQDGFLFIAMRYVEGTDLKTLIRKEGPLDPARTERIVEQVAHALDAAHAKGLVHRDVKPGNVLLAPPTGSRPEHAYLSDFGLSKRAASDSGLTGTGVFAGTLNYAAPEQFQGAPLDARTDVYSLGCVVFECLTGELPFRREQDAALMYAHLHESPPSAMERRPELPAAVDDVIRTAMAKAPERRYESARELAAALRAASESPEDGAARPPRRRRVAAALVSVGVVAAGLLLLVTTRGDGEGAVGAPTPSPSAGGSADSQPPGSIVRVDAETGQPTLTVPDIPGLASDGPFRPTLAVGEGGVWLHTFGNNKPFLLDLDAATGEVRERTSANGFLGGTPPDVAVGSRTVWYLGAGLDEVQRLNPLTYEHLPPFKLRSGSVTGMALGDDALWVGTSDGSVSALDPLTGELASEIDVDATPDELAVGQGSVWVADRLAGEVVRVDPVEQDVVDRVAVPGELSDIAAGDAGVWILDRSAGTIMRIDGPVPAAPIRVGPTPFSIAVGHGAVWVTDEDGHLYRADPQLGSSEAIGLGRPLGPVAIDEVNGAIWVGVLEGATDPE
jgi:tRNA A-37 threonylcarbamoyl transferase component Bud32/streptogramin lyase